MDHPSPSETPNPSDHPGDITRPDRWFPGQVLFGRYQVIREIGRGGMGVVLLARDSELGIDIALKLILDLLIHDDETLEDLKKEVLKGMTLTHPGIVRTHGFVRDEAMAAIVMEYVDGGTFHDLKRLQPGGCFDADDLLPWIEQLCPALDYAHFEIQIAHRDLKPRNLMYTLAGRIKVADFGISSTLEDSVTRATVKGSSSGTPAYMSPQQVMGGRPSHLDDIYGLGATLYELLTGKPPFHKGEVVYQVLECVPPTVEARRGELGVTGKAPLPPAWESAIAACLSKEPSQRPQSAGELVQWLNQPPDVQAPIPSPLELASEVPVEMPAAPRRRRKPAMRWLPHVATAVLLAIGSLVVFSTDFFKQPETPPIIAPLTITSGEVLPVGEAGFEYRQQLSATGGTPPYQWSLSSGEPPAGIRIEPDGSVTGTPSNVSFADFEIVVSDAGDRSARQKCRLTINPRTPIIDPPVTPPAAEIPPPKITSPPVLPQGMAGTPYHFQLSGEGGSPPWLWSLSSGRLPPGLALSAEGVITGIPQDAATETFDLRATDRMGAEAFLNASLSILPKVPVPPVPVFNHTKEEPYINSLGMRFVPSGTDKVYFSVWLTRVGDFRAFVRETGHDAKVRVLSVEKGGVVKGDENEDMLKALGDDWEQPGFVQTDDRPVCAVSWEDAKKFCSWLTKKEQQAGTLPKDHIYRLPFDSEWRRALCLEQHPDEDPPAFPWGNGGPPNLRCNLAGGEIRNHELPRDLKEIAGFRDNMPYTSTVDHFPANALGIHDIYGNVWQFCEDATKLQGSRRLLRGGSWLTSDRKKLALAAAYDRIQSGRGVDAGFRCVISPLTSPEP